MLGLVAIGVMLSIVSSQDLIGVSYKFDVDFNRTFNNKTCATNESWELIDYASLKFTSASLRSSRGIRSSEESCVSSFLIVFFNNVVLELNVYLDVFAEDSGLKTTIFNEDNIPKVTYFYNRTSKNFKPGWNTISIPINKNLTGYVNLFGRSHDDEIVIVDSFRYMPSNTENLGSQKHVFEIDESDLLLENIHAQSELLFDYEGSGEDGDFGSGEEDLQFGEEFDEEDMDEKGITKIEV